MNNTSIRWLNRLKNYKGNAYMTDETEVQPTPKSQPADNQVSNQFLTPEAKKLLKEIENSGGTVQDLSLTKIALERAISKRR